MGSWRSGACGGEGGGGERGPSWTEAGSWLQSSSSGPPRSTPDVGALVVVMVVVEAGVSEVVASDVGASEVGLSGVGLLWVEVSVVLPEVSGASTSECTYEQLQGLGLISGLGEREREASRLGAHQPEVLAPVRDARAAHLLRHGLHVGLHDELPTHPAAQGLQQSECCRTDLCLPDWHNSTDCGYRIGTTAGRRQRLRPS